MSTYSSAALGYFADHAINPEIAQVLGVREDKSSIVYPYKDDAGTFERRRPLDGDRTFQPSGRGLAPWSPIDHDGVLLVCEGESDLLAVTSVLFVAEDLAAPGEAPSPYLARRQNLPPPIAELTPIALPGAGACHDQVADLAEKKIADCWIALDGDKTGRDNAAKLKAKIDAKEGVSAGILELPDDKDLSDVLAAAENPAEALAELVAEAQAEENGEEVTPVTAVTALDQEALPATAITGLLKQVTELLDRYIVLPGDHERIALALFVAHSYAIEGAHATPYMLVISPEKRSGKSRLLSVLELAVARPWGVIGASEAAMFRKIAKDRPTLLLDEIDAIWGSFAERTEPLRAIINAGNRPGATVARCVGENKDVEDFPIYCAKVLAGIDSGHRIPDTIRDRSVAIHMQRKTGAEPVERFRYRIAKAETEPMRTAFEGWGLGACDLLLDADPHLPAELDDRAAEAWEPLFAIADMAGSEWPALARNAALALSGGDDRDEATTGTMLLTGIKNVVGDKDRITTTELLATINADEELAFGGWRDGKGLDGRLLARFLKPYGIRPRTIKVEDGSTAKGYLRSQFTEAWERWLTTPSDSAVTSVTTVTEDESVTDKPLEQAEVTGVTAVTALDHQGTGGTEVTASPAEETEAERLAEKFEEAA